MATDDEILLDAFVRVSPDPNFLQAVDKVADDAIKRITEKFAAVTIPGPKIGDSAGPAGAVSQQSSQLAQLNSQQQAAEQRREQAAQRLLDLQREIENLQGRGRTTFTPASRERAIQAEVRATEELQRAQREYARLLSANDPSVSSEDAAIQKQIVEYQKERNQAEKDYLQSIRDVEQAQLKTAKFEKPSRSKFTAEAVAAAQAERDRIAASGAGAVEIAAAELRLEEIRTKFAASQAKRSKDAQKAQDDLQAAIVRSTEAEARRTALSAEIVTDTDALAKARIAAEQRVEEANERVAAAKIAVTRQDEGAQRYTETRAARLAAAQAELVSATQAEVDARQQVLSINEQILSVTRAQAAAEASVTAEVQRQAQADAAQPPSANPPSAAGGSRQPPRRRGRGRAGTTPPPPPDPPTTPPDDDGADELARALLAARRQAEDLNREIGRINKLKPEIGTQEVKLDLRILQAAVEDLRVRLARAGQDNDLLGIQEAISNIPELQRRLEQVSTRLSAAGNLRKEFDEVAERAKRQIEDGRRTAGLNRSLNPGIPSGKDREDLLLYIDAIRKQEAEVKRLAAAFDGTEESVNRLREAERKLTENQDRLAQKEDLIAQTRGRSFNTLSNNAYQLGQAFEDFSVGFSLNGLAGGIRGAANNVAFLLNDLSRLESTKAFTTDLFVRFRKDIPVEKARELGERMANLIPLAAGIGSALAITVLPKMVEWLESLNDIEIGLQDISTQIKRSVEDTNFQIRLRVDNDELRRTVTNAESVRDILEQIRTISESTASKETELNEIFTGLSNPDRTGLAAIISDTEKLRKASLAVLEVDERRLKNIKEIEASTLRSLTDLSEGFLPSLLPSLGGAASGNTLKTTVPILRDLEAALRNFRVESERVSKDGLQGIAKTEALDEIISQIDIIKKSAGQIAELNILDTKSADEIARVTSSIAELEPQIKRVRDLSLEISDAYSKQFRIAIDGAISKTNELADRQLLIRRRIAGSVDEQAVFLADVREASSEYAKLIESVADFYRKSGRDPAPLVNQLRTQEIFRSENEVLEDQEKLIEDIRDAEDRLAALRERNTERSKKSQFTNFDDFTKNLQTNVLSIEPIDKNTDAIEKLSDEVRILNFRLAQRNATLENLPTQFTDPEGFQRRQRGIEFARPFDEQQAMAQLFDRTGLLVGVGQATERAQVPEFQVNEIANAVKKGVEEAMRGLANPIVNEQKNTTDAVRKIGGATAR